MRDPIRDPQPGDGVRFTLDNPAPGGEHVVTLGSRTARKVWLRHQWPGEARPHSGWGWLREWRAYCDVPGAVVTSGDSDA